MTRFVQYDACTLWVVAHSALHNTMLHMHANTPTHARPVPAIPSTHTSAHPCARITAAKPTHGYLAVVSWWTAGRFAPGASFGEETRLPSFGNPLMALELERICPKCLTWEIMWRRAPDKPTKIMFMLKNSHMSHFRSCHRRLRAPCTPLRSRYQAGYALRKHSPQTGRPFI